MTWLATWPSSNRVPAGCEAYDTENAALVKARAVTAAGAPHVVVYEISDTHIHPDRPIEEQAS